jgi:hypothetical protein
MSDLEPLDPDIRALVERARGEDDIDPDRRAAILGAVATRAGWAATGAAAAAGSAHAAAHVSTAGLVARTKAILLTTFVVGLGAGVVVDRQLLPPARAPVVVMAPRPTPETPATDLARARAPVEAPGVPVSALPNAASPSRALPAAREARADDLP